MKKIFLFKLKILFLSFIHIVCIKSVEPVTTAVTAGIALVTKGIGSAAINYWYQSEEDSKRILKKHLNSLSYQSSVAHGCNENFEENCYLYAEILKKVEKYNAARYESLCIEYQKGNNEMYIAQGTDQSFFETLSEDEQKKVLKLERDLVIQFTNPSNHKEEIACLHTATNRS